MECPRGVEWTGEEVRQQGVGGVPRIMSLPLLPLAETEARAG